MKLSMSDPIRHLHYFSHLWVISSSQFSRCLTQHVSMMKWLTHFSYLEQSSGEKKSVSFVLITFTVKATGVV